MSHENITASKNFIEKVMKRAEEIILNKKEHGILRSDLINLLFEDIIRYNRGLSSLNHNKALPEDKPTRLISGLMDYCATLVSTVQDVYQTDETTLFNIVNLIIDKAGGFIISMELEGI